VRLPESLGQVGWLARRSVRRTARQPAAVVPSLLFPLMLMAVNVGGLDAATRLPGFPADSYLDFALAFAFVQGALFAAANAGADLARDIENGFLNRLALTPMRGAALVFGQLAGVMALGLLQGVVYLAVGLTAGASVAAGVPGALLVIVFAVGLALAFGAVGTAFALRTGSGEATQALFPLLFVTVFLSSSNLPRPLIEVDWFRAVATANPVSYMIEGVRSLLVTGWDGQALALGAAAILGVAAVALTASAALLSTRLVRT
jgi:ABC-2 type transport system permease protein